MLSAHGKKQNAPDISRKSIAEVFPLTKPGDTVSLLRQPNQGDREALYSEPHVWKVHWSLLAVKP